MKPAIVDENGKTLEGPCEGNLCIADSWPSQARTLFGDHERFIETYFTTYPGYYFSGDGCRRDEDGYYWITGRVDDVLNVSGHRMVMAEIESALVAHDRWRKLPSLAIRMMSRPGIYAYVTLNAGRPSEELRKELVACARDRSHRHPGPDPMGPESAEDALREDHAHPAQDRGE